MSTIHRSLVLNPVEPAPVSMKLRTGLDMKITVDYLRQDGSPYTTDLGGQLYLISRSSGTVMMYALPATDVVNGKAGAFIPAGDIGDRNGYNIQIIGTVDGDPQLIARGSASVYETEALGIIPADIIDDVPIYLSYNFDASISVRLWQDVAKTTPFDLTAATVSAAIYTSSTNPTMLVPFTVTPTVIPGEVMLQLTFDIVNTLPSGCWWSLRASTAAGVTTLCQGSVTISGVAP